MEHNEELFDEDESAVLEWWEQEYDDDVSTSIYNKTTKELVTKITGIVPDPHEIGLQFGSGEYRAMIRGKRATGGKLVTKDFKISKAYDDLKKSPAVNLSGMGQGNDISMQVANGLAFGMKSIISELAPLFPSLMEAFKPKEPTYGVALEQMYGSMNRILETNTKKQMENFTEFQRQLMQNTADSMSFHSNYEEEDEDEEEGINPMSAIFGMVKPILAGAMPEIIGGRGAEIIGGIKNNPLFIQVVSNPAVMREIENWVLNEFGFDALKILKEFL